MDDAARSAREAAAREILRQSMRAKLDRDGLAKVEYAIAHGRVEEGARGEILQEWLDEKRVAPLVAAERERLAAEREARLEQAVLDNLHIARSAKNASWFAAFIAALALGVASYAALREFPVSHDALPAVGKAMPSPVEQQELRMSSTRAQAR